MLDLGLSFLGFTRFSKLLVCDKMCFACVQILSVTWGRTIINNSNDSSLVMNYITSCYCWLGIGRCIWVQRSLSLERWSSIVWYSLGLCNLPFMPCLWTDSSSFITTEEASEEKDKDYNVNAIFNYSFHIRKVFNDKKDY